MPKELRVIASEHHNTRVEFFQVHMLSEHLPPFSLRVAIGLKRDYEVKSEGVELRLHKGVFLPQESYKNCDMLPKTWMEIIDR